jgi:Tfp pilus assembly protein PilF
MWHWLLLASVGFARFEELHELGVRALKTSQLAAARNTLLTALLLQPSNSGVHHDIGVYYNIKDSSSQDQAEYHYRQAKMLNPESAIALCSLGGILRQTSRYHESLEELATALMLDPDFYRAHVEAGLTYVSLVTLYL